MSTGCYAATHQYLVCLDPARGEPRVFDVNTSVFILRS